MGSANSSEANRFWLCPLYSFDCYSESVELAEGIQIKPALLGLSEYIQKQTHDLYGQWDDPSEYNGVVLLPYRAKDKGVSGGDKLIRIGLVEGDRARDLLLDLITASRLCHEGKITAGPLISSSVTHDSQWSFGSTVMWTLVSKRDFFHQEPKYILHQSDVPQINELMKNLNNLRKEKKLPSIGVALRRFNSSYHGNIEDRLIDQMIAFESLCLGYDQELKYRLALRVAFLLGKDEGERKDIFNKMRKAYKLRSDIVHGNKQLGWPELEEVVSETEEYLRQSIRKFSFLLSKEHPLNLKELREGTDRRLPKLEENILSNGVLLASDDFGQE